MAMGGQRSGKGLRKTPLQVYVRIAPTTVHTMTLRYTLAVLHLLPLTMGLAALYARGRALRRVNAPDQLPAVFLPDNWYGAAALLWVGTGLWRAFGGLEKGTEHYLNDHWFLGKMGVFGLVFVLELLPMFWLVRWRMDLRKGRTPDLSKAPLLAGLSYAQLPLLVLMVAMAAAMARGL
jgi:putative membrane protein